MKHFIVSSFFILFSSTIFCQSLSISLVEIHQNSLLFNVEGANDSDVVLEYGKTKKLELGTAHGLEIDQLKDATFYYVKAKSKNEETDIQLVSTASKSVGDITVYFNQSVDNNASSIADAISISAFEDTLISYINQAQTTLDICNYNTGSLPIVNAINSAKNSGIVVRYIAADNTGTNNSQLSALLPSIPLIQRPNDGEVMHNKFMIIDAANPSLAKVVTGSVNHTINSCTNDYNNMVIVEDQSVALAYKTEFEEMWGSTGLTPNALNAKFGNAKTDNTPHLFNVGGKQVEIYFSPSDGTTAKIENAILSANTDMQFSMFTYINNSLGDAVIAIHNAGVNVKGIIENVFYFGSEYNGLLSAGVDVYSHFSIPYLLHHKYGIVDANDISSDPLVITGSHNWTNSAENDYDENTLIIHDASIANMYYEEFMARYSDVGGIASVSDFDNEQTAIYPVPFKNELTVKSEENIESITIRNAKGKVEFKSEFDNRKEINVNCSAFASGVYFIEVMTKKGVSNMKIVRVE